MAVAEPQPREEVSWHGLADADVMTRLSTAPSGLSGEEAARHLAVHGPNELQAIARSSPWHTLAEQFKNVLVLILLAATAISGLLGHGLEAAVIAVIVLFAVLLGFVQEYRAERALRCRRTWIAWVGCWARRHWWSSP